MKFYPLTFTPILKNRIWGGTKLKTYLNKPIVSETTGESWEISTVPGDISVVNNGFLKGKNINEVIDLYPEEILGKSVITRFGNQFPLLFKFIDAKEDLSIQLHPNDVLAKERHNSFGKTEMWYVMQADAQARLVVGFKKDSNQQEYIKQLENKKSALVKPKKAKSGRKPKFDPKLFKVGDEVRLKNSHQKGKISSIEKEKAEVNIGFIKTIVSINDLRPVETIPTLQSSKAKRNSGK